MKLFKKIVSLGLAALTCLSFGLASACENVETPGSGGGDVDFLYRVKVQNATGYGFSGTRVALLDGGREIAHAKTDRSGYATFVEGDIDGVGEYTIKVTDIPNGYDFSSSKTYKTGAWAGYESYVQIEPTGVIKDTPPLGTFYSLGKVGEVMYDFTATTSDGNEFTLSEVLQEKELVVLNFWATWCGPCKEEFPAMNNAYKSYEDRVSILAISTTNSMAEVSDFKAKNGLTFDMTSGLECGANVLKWFDTSGVPVTVMIDRYGAITYYHMGNMTAAIDFTTRFDKFLGDDYKPTVIVGTGDDGGDGSGSSSNLIKPNVAPPSLNGTNSINTVLTGDSGVFEFSWLTEDESAEYSWPWLISSDRSYIYSPIAANSLHGNFSTLNAKFTAKPGDVLYFDYMVHTETEDVLYVVIDGVPVQQISGTNNTGSWVNNFGAYVFKENYDEAGEHELSLLFQKDSSGSVDGEAVQIKNLRISNDPQNANSNVFRHAASILDEDIWTCNICHKEYKKFDLVSVPKDKSENAEKIENCCPNCYNEGKDNSKVSVCEKTYTAPNVARYKHYADVVLNEVDGYYHVGSKNGPLLFANLMLSSRWSEWSVWNLAYSNYIVASGYDFKDEIESEAWAANQPVPDKQLTYGYAPVTENLKELLIFATKSKPVAEDGLKYWTGAWHQNEWLETCVYFENYGQAAPIDDPMKTITFHAAEKVTIGTMSRPVANQANVMFSMAPRGFKYKIVPEESGVYNIYSLGNNNTVCFFFGESTTAYEYYDDVIGATHENGTPDDNFNFHVYLEAGKTYYLALTTYLDVATKYDFYVTYVGNQYSYMKQCTSGAYSYNQVTGEQYIPDAIRYYYDAANDVYRTLKGDVIYVDMLRPTLFDKGNSLYNRSRDALRQNADGSYVYAPEERAYYIDNTDDDVHNGTDYSEVIRKYGRIALLNDGDLEGFAPLNKELFEAIYAIATADRYDGVEDKWLKVEDAWQLFCFYYTVLGA